MYYGFCPFFFFFIVGRYCDIFFRFVIFLKDGGQICFVSFVVLCLFALVILDTEVSILVVLYRLSSYFQFHSFSNNCSVVYHCNFSSYTSVLTSRTSVSVVYFTYHAIFSSALMQCPHPITHLSLLSVHTYNPTVSLFGWSIPYLVSIFLLSFLLSCLIQLLCLLLRLLNI